jgi:hypothetical protein
MTVQIRNPELIRLLAADFVTRRELVTTPGNRVTLTNTDLTVAGGGALTLSAAGAYTLTIPKTGTVPVGTGTAGRIAEWVTDANTVQASTLAKTGAGVLTLSASGNFTLTVPATGTAALLGTANVFTAGQTINGDLTVDTNTFFVDATNNRVGVGIASPTQKFHVYDTASYIARFEANSASAFAGYQVQADSASVHINSQTFGTSVAGTQFGVTRAGTTSLFSDGALLTLGTKTNHIVVFGVNNAEVMRMTTSARLLVGTTTDNAQLSVNQSSATGAVPTLRLRQADLSEEMIRFDTTVGTGNPVNTTALGSYYGRVRVWVEGVGERWLALYNT